MKKRISLLVLLASALVSRAAEPPEPEARPIAQQSVAITTGLVRLPQSLTAQFSLPVATAPSTGVKRVFTREEYRLLLQRFARTSGVQVLPLPRLVSMNNKRSTVEIVKGLRYPTEYNPGKNSPQTLIPNAIETVNLGLTIEIKPSSTLR